ncbi:MAG: cation:proton antiporter [Bacteroidales bacterium]|nr:cation:proton antiporter [Bacteroidales bacterium]MCF8391744.1 cation:proton antiporter [Bacteroidales bacterium]
MENFSSYTLIIAGAIIIILSYAYNLISTRTSIPSVLLLITTGLLLKLLLKLAGIESIDFSQMLEILGVIGLIMIVLEASLDLKLGRDKTKLIARTFLLAFLSVVLTGGIISLIFILYLDTSFTTALLYAIPLSIISSAIVIPSTANLPEKNKEFMIYESTFSDILGIMIFYFSIESIHSESASELGWHIFSNILITVVISFIISYLLIFIFQKIKTEVKLFLLIAVLILLYSIAKMMHFSSLLIILVFGLVLQNRHIFFPGKMKKILDESVLKEISLNFKIITLESSFVVRTFFFVIFGISISLATLFNFKVVLISIIIIGIIYGIRFALFKLMRIKTLLPELFLAPRGLITILLFYAIPEELRLEGFNPGILLFIIIASSVAMAVALIKNKKTMLTDGPELEIIEMAEEEESDNLDEH